MGADILPGGPDLIAPRIQDLVHFFKLKMGCDSNIEAGDSFTGNHIDTVFAVLQLR